ncbi:MULTISPECIES: hypothetical protein [Pseudonocardia]|uniref:Uncharacterized protein n=1 Tax=Pseudonocardia alni TaxID=33907 RepID=A0A852W3H1_PSEA5|nr:MULTISPECIES: hypothetical protein [Pseudonocardia]MCM3845439.1 hypothetical protein [Pseudonocardia sp. DR1-2]NYG03289.1 hypothetical protein [Pseudonocardia antarctica]
MLLSILAVAPVLAVLLVMAAQPLFELWDARASDHDRARSVAPAPSFPDVPVSAGPVAFPESLGDVTAALSIPHPRRPGVPHLVR